MGCARRNWFVVQVVIALQVRSEVAVAATDSNCEVKSHTVSMEQMRSLVAVAALVSNSQSALHAVTGAQLRSVYVEGAAVS